MNTRKLSVVVAHVAAAILVFIVAVPTMNAGQQTPPAAKPAGPAPRMADGKPDMTGVWVPAPGGGDGLLELEKLYTPAAHVKIQPLGEPDDPLLRCLPYGVPRAIVSSPWPFQIVQRPGMMVVLTEYYHAFRLIPTDGSPHPADPLPTYLGETQAAGTTTRSSSTSWGSMARRGLRMPGIGRRRPARACGCIPPRCTWWSAGA